MSRLSQQPVGRHALGHRVKSRQAGTGAHRQTDAACGRGSGNACNHTNGACRCCCCALPASQILLLLLAMQLGMVTWDLQYTRSASACIGKLLEQQDSGAGMPPAFLPCARLHHALLQVQAPSQVQLLQLLQLLQLAVACLDFMSCRVDHGLASSYVSKYKAGVLTQLQLRASCSCPAPPPSAATQLRARKFSTGVLDRRT